jgi:hypothetical protein
LKLADALIQTTGRKKHTLLTPFCQTQEVRPGDLSGLTVTSSLSTGRALEKARFFSGAFRKRTR